MDHFIILQHLGIALAIGLLVGTERGWHERDVEEGRRVAGIRTFALTGLLGGLIGVVALKLTVGFAGLAFAGFAALVVAGHWISSRNDDSQLGITTEVALLVTLSLGLLSTLGFPLIAAASAVVTTILLGLKPVLHVWLTQLSERELHAALKLLLISVVLLPLLPDQGFGPWDAFNPYHAWWMVVLVSGLSFIGYFAIKLAGPQRGIMVTSLLGGLVSSTAVTLNLARYARDDRYTPRLLAAGVLAAFSIMFPRVLIEVSVVNAELVPLLLPTLLVMTLVTLGGAVYLWRGINPDGEVSQTRLPNPFELGNALKFGLLLALIMVLASGARAWFGDAGLYTLAVVSGLADVDALTLSVARLSTTDLALEVARNTILIAVFTNTLVKVMLATAIGGMALGMRAASVSLLAIALGTVTLFLTSS
ncbi:MAG TPA: MgtC/SapB family protein [Chromatiales bacterium]|nr:MgtC/SapB family protein [Chromatiales bacterium]